MSTTTMTIPPSTPMTISRSDKPMKKQKIVLLKVPSTFLQKFVIKTQSESEEMPTVKTTSQEAALSTPSSTPLPVNDVPSPSSTTDKQPPSVNGLKRSPPAPDSKPRARPGPKKKPRLEDGTIDHSSTKPTTTTNNASANPRLGPKANTGFINANLRALDRTGTPCRKWQRKGFSVKSFTGVSWELPSWKGSANSALINGSDSSTKDISMGSDQKPSETDTDDHDKMEITYAASSPPPMPAKTNGITV